MDLETSTLPTMATALPNCITDTRIREYSECYCRETHAWQETRSLVEFSLTFLSGLTIIEGEVNTCISKPCVDPENSDGVGVMTTFL